ncbi:MAG: IS3 family transposase [Anaerolineae bacterium]|nr:IS3 family transposase [Anaerolineae bacterium]
MKYQAIEASKGEYPVSRLCAVLNIAESGYYAWLNQAPSAHKQENQELEQCICTIWKQYRGIYGAPRIHAELQEQGINVGHNRVARLMRQTGIQGKTTRKRRTHTTQSDPSHPVAANVLDRQFTAKRPNEVWLTDITYIDTAEGFLYLAAVMDLYSRQIVGMAMADHLRTDLVESALDMALTQRRPPRNLLHHSDRGSQYTSMDYQKRLSASYMTVSMSRVGNCWDNAPMESFWATLKRECADIVFASHSQARVELFSYIMSFYNRQRRHSTLGFVSPYTFESRRLPFTPLN